MITKLRRKFIFITMCSTFAVLAVIIGTLNLVSYRNIVERADRILDLLADNDAAFPESMQDKGVPPRPLEHTNDGIEKDRPYEWKRKDMSPETPYETRYFSVKLQPQGQVISVDTGKIAAVATEAAVDYAQKIWKSGKKYGFCDNYRYRVVAKDGYDMILFVDRSRELSGFYTLSITSISVSAIGLTAVFILVIIFSKMVFQPVAEGYEKQKRFITDASHELKTPLSIISANVEVLELENEANAWTGSIKKQVGRLSGLVEQLVTLSRLDESNVLQAAADFSLSDTVMEIAALFQPVADSKGKKIELSVEEGLTLYGDERMIGQMLSLLLDNAVKYSSENGKIKISARQKGKLRQITVWNEADEITKGNQDILFERFYRRDASRNSETGGSGIGLSIVKAIVTTHKGKISACSEDGSSLQITVTL